ncbi:hypothetical protein [Roseomonas indoligenes]|uniref:Uncharacterized protein n=1 Tax=Roseomonas indoligenes TaxID=2820811 RepID=A0A940MWD4_9PROT|nr:hypothetical protein [Pararoseomonas indoligenes]MBP0492210.1 hypothetical protein [Pararoseomonas indoligenes]
MNAVMPPRMQGWTCELDRMSAAAELPKAQQGANASLREVMALFEEEVAAVEFVPEHPTLTWIDYRETERVERAMRAAWAAFGAAMGRAAL